MGCSGDCSCKDTSAWDDDVWGDDDVKATADIERAHHKQGYLDGLTQAKESSLQEGFDDAFPKGAQLGVEVGLLLAKAMCTDEETFKRAKEELNITKVLAKKYFNEDVELVDRLLLEKWGQTLS